MPLSVEYSMVSSKPTSTLFSTVIEGTLLFSSLVNPTNDKLNLNCPPFNASTASLSFPSIQILTFNPDFTSSPELLISNIFLSPELLLDEYDAFITSFTFVNLVSLNEVEFTYRI